MAEKRFGIKPAVGTECVGSPTATGQARGPNDVGSPMNQDKATETYDSGGATGPKAGNSGKDSLNY